MQKVVRNGKVAVLYSPDYGAGWYSWNTEIPECLFDPEIVQMVENNVDKSEIVKLAEEKWPKGYWSARDLKIAWLDEGTLFQILEYDGAEEIELSEGKVWLTA
jgi:hypothetical protein